MASDVERLIVRLEATQRQFEKQLASAASVADRRARQIETRFQKMNKSLDGLFAKSFKGLITPLTGVGAALGIREIVQLADTWTELKSRVDLAAGSMENGEVVMGRLSEMARRTYSGLEQTAESWLNNATALKELGYSTSEQLDLVETLNNALVISAAKGDRAASVMNAWSKAMALGKLSGDNLNTIIQSGGRLAEALAASMGVSTNQLRKLGQEGKITTAEMYGVTSQLEKLREEADGMAATVGDAMQLLKDAMLQYVGGADQASQMSAKLAESIILLADNFGPVADIALQLATVLAGSLTGRALVGMINTLPAAGVAITGLVAAMRAGTLTAVGFTAALGPIGLVLGGVSAALYLYANQQSEVEYQTDRATKAADLNAKALETGKDASGKYTQALRDQIAMQVEVTRSAYIMADAAFTSAAKTAQAFAAMTGLRFAPLDFNMQTKRAEVEALNDALLKLELQLEEIDKVGTTKPTRTVPSSDSKGKSSTKERADEYERLAARIADSTAALIAETEVQRGLNPLVNDYGYAVERARAEQELLNAALAAGIQITSELRQQIGQLADQYATATVEAAQLAEAQDKTRQRAEEMRALGKDVLGGFISDLKSGISASEALANALDKIASKLLDMALNNLFENAFGGAGGGLFGGGGLLGGILIPGILHKGGVAGKDGYGHGRAVSPSTFTGAKRYHRGGVAGLQPGEVPAILQRGEVVLPRGSQMGAQAQQIEVSVSGVFVDDNGVVRAQVTQMGAQAAQAGATIAVRQVGQGLPSMIADAQARKM